MSDPSLWASAPCNRRPGPRAGATSRRGLSGWADKDFDTSAHSSSSVRIRAGDGKKRKKDRDPTRRARLRYSRPRPQNADFGRANQMSRQEPPCSVRLLDVRQGGRQWPDRAWRQKAGRGSSESPGPRAPIRRHMQPAIRRLQLSHMRLRKPTVHNRQVAAVPRSRRASGNGRERTGNFRWGTCSKRTSQI